MLWLWLTLLVLSPLLVFLFVGWMMIYRGRCVRCQRHRLRMVGGYKWDGPRRGGIVTYYLCKNCNAPLKKCDKDWSEPTDEEWAQRVHARAMAQPNKSRQLIRLSAVATLTLSVLLPGCVHQTQDNAREGLLSLPY